MMKCDCYDKKEVYRFDPNNFNHRQTETVGVCNGTRERDECSCNGDQSKCNFYPEKRKKAVESKTKVKVIVKKSDSQFVLNKLCFYRDHAMKNGTVNIPYSEIKRMIGALK